MPALSDAHKRLIVQRLATFVTPTEIQEELKEAGVAASLSQIVYYDPESKGSDVAPKWRELHRETRAAFIRETSSIAISHKAYRLRELGRMYRKASSGARPNIVLAKDLLEQAAKEVGEAYTNRRILVSPNPMEDLAKLLGMTPELIAAALAMEDGPADDMSVQA